MGEQNLWRLFWEAGLPSAYLAIRALRRAAGTAAPRRADGPEQSGRDS